MMFSIIIPVYNVKPYLRECLNSVLAQTFTDWECLCVDDGSIDGSGAILDEYASRNPCFRVFHKTNGGVSSARNLGIENAIGEWIWFIDSDDIIHPQALDHIASTLKKQPTIDAYAFEGISPCISAPKTYPELPDSNPRVSSDHGYWNFMYFCRSTFNLVYRRDKFSELRFPPLSVGEDLLFSSTLFWKVGIFAVEDVPLYYYRQRKGSATSGKISVKAVGDNLVSLKQILDGILQNREWTDGELHAFLSRFQRLFLAAHKDGFVNLNDDERKLVLNEWIALQTLIVSQGEGMRYVRLSLWLLRCIPSGHLARILVQYILRANNRSIVQITRTKATRCWRRVFGLLPFSNDKPMRLGVAYNLFDGEELLENSIRSIRENVDFVCVVYQEISNSGERRETPLKPFLDNLVESGLIDSIVPFEPPRHFSRFECEKSKRLAGIKECQKNGCTHFLDMDTDEFYRSAEFRTAKDFINRNSIDVSAVSIIEYVKSPVYRLVSNYMFAHCDNPIDYVFYVPFICRITDKPFVGLFPCLTDPTRAIFRTGRFFLFPKHEIAMHHMSTVRKDLAKKLRNSTSYTNPQFQRIANSIRRFDFGDARAKIPEGYGFIDRYLIERVPNEFSIDIVIEH